MWTGGHRSTGAAPARVSGGLCECGVFVCCPHRQICSTGNVMASAGSTLGCLR
jgi:hypothetical protein